MLTTSTSPTVSSSLFATTIDPALQDLTRRGLPQLSGQQTALLL